MTTYCSKSKGQLTREYMREYRSRRRADEIVQIILNEQDEDLSMDTSNIIDQATADIAIDPIMTIDDRVSPTRSDSEDELHFNAHDIIDETHSNNGDITDETHSDAGDIIDGDLEGENDDDDVDEFIDFYDLNNQTKLFPSCLLTIREACHAIIKLARRLNLNKNGIKHLLDGIRILFPIDVKLPRTVKRLMKIIGFDCSKQVIYYCRECLCRLHTPEQIKCADGCSLNNKRRSFLNVIELVVNNVKDEIYSTAKRYLNLINEYSDCSNTLLPYDVPNGSIYQRLKIKNQRQLSIMLHTDGAPVTKINGKSLWPVQATILEIPPPVRDHTNAVMVFAAWLGGTHPNRELLWDNIIEQIQDLYKNGIQIKLHDNTKVKFNIRVQLITFDLPALAHNCNIIQFNGYDACPFCKVRGHAIGTQIYYSYSPIPSPSKTDDDYLRLAVSDLPRSTSIGIKGPTPLTKIMLFPIQIAVDYMHLVCSGHFKTLINYWNQLLLSNVFDQASKFLLSVTLPHSFGYQFMPLVQFTNWKTKMFRDLLLYVSPILVILFLPDQLALHFLHYFIYIRVLHFYQNKDELHGIDYFFDYYYEHLAEHYGPKSELCSVHIHSHLLAQVYRHGSLVTTSCFPRESYIGNAMKWCHGKKYILEQFTTWYKLDHMLYPDNSMDIHYLTQRKQFDEKYLNYSLIESLNDKFVRCCVKKNIYLDGKEPVKKYSRYFYGLKTFHSLSYVRGGNAISYWVSIKNEQCSQKHGICFGEVLYYFQFDNEYYAFIKHFKCIDKSLSDGLSSTSVPQNLLDRLNMYMESSIQRPQRTTAGKTSKFADFSVVSFPQLKKHSIIKTALINIDPLSSPGAQSGNIKAYGERKKLLVIKSGTRHEMEEISSRFSKESGSEEILIPERECEYSRLSDVRQETFDDNMDDDEYTPPQQAKKSTQPTTTTDTLPILSGSGFDKDDDDNDDDFDRILPNRSRSRITKMSKRKRKESDSSSLSASSDCEHDENRWSKNKENLLKTNIDLANLNKKKSNKKKQRTDPIVVQQSDADYKSLYAEVDRLKKRVSKLEKVYGIFKKGSSLDQTKRTSTSDSPIALQEETLGKVKDIFGVDPSGLRSPINRPTKVMRELYRTSGYELTKWKEYLEPNESVLKDFIQQKCLVLDEDISYTWSSIMNSMTQMPYDAVKYKSKPDGNPATIAVDSPIINDDEHEQQSKTM